MKAILTWAAGAVVARRVSISIVFVLASCVVCVAQNALVGRGSFMFEPLEGKRVTLHYYVPPTATPESAVVIVCHGLSRDADNYRDRWMSEASRHGLVIVAPEFSKDLFPGSRGYALGNVFRDGNRPRRHELNDEDDWTFSAIESIFDEIKRRAGNATERYYIFGHSAGAQFVHRLLFFKPAGRYAGLIAANAGWYTMPTETIGFPYGTGLTPIDDFSFFSQPLTVMIGTEDNDPNGKNLRRTSEANRQGRHRYARAHYFYNISKQKADRLGIPFAWKIVDVPGVGHSGSRMSGHAADYLFGGDQ